MLKLSVASRFLVLGAFCTSLMFLILGCDSKPNMAAEYGESKSLAGQDYLAKAPVFPQELQGTKSLEIGELILLLMPDAGAELVRWDHRANTGIVWSTEGYDSRKVADVVSYSFREGMVRANIQGAIATVLKQQKMELGWRVTFYNHSIPKFGVEEILIEPGTPAETCFGTNYEGCQFEVPLKSLASVSIKARSLCRRDGADSASAFELSHLSRRSTVMLWSTSCGSSGCSSDIKLLLNAKADSRPCDKSDADSAPAPAPAPAPARAPAPAPAPAATRPPKDLDKELSYCLMPKAQYGKYSSFDGGKSAATLLQDGCTKEYLEWVKACVARENSEKSCVVKAAIVAQSAIKMFGK